MPSIPQGQPCPQLPPYSDCGIYAFLNIATGKVYVGASVRLSSRYRHHLSDLRCGTHHNSYLQRAWEQDAACFAIAVLEHCAPEQLHERECYWIGALRAADREYGYNLDMVRGRRLTHSTETRSKIAEANRGRFATPEARAKISAANRARIHQPEVLAKLRAARARQAPDSLETRAKKSAASRNISPETRAKLSAAKLGNTHTKGRKVSPETRAKMSEAQKARHARTRQEVSNEQ